MTLGEFMIRFIIGGLFVSAFAVLDVLKPKSFAGLVRRRAFHRAGDS
jgi:hypothetical protein